MHRGWEDTQLEEPQGVEGTVKTLPARWGDSVGLKYESRNQGGEVSLRHLTKVNCYHVSFQGLWEVEQWPEEGDAPFTDAWRLSGRKEACAVPGLCPSHQIRLRGPQTNSK